MTETKITGRQIIVIASLIFGVLFGAGNLIFPVHLGQLAGAHWRVSIILCTFENPSLYEMLT